MFQTERLVMTAGPERNGGFSNRIPEKERVVSVENPVVPVKPFEAKLMISYFNPLVDAVGAQFRKLEVMMAELGVPLFGSQQESQNESLLMISDLLNELQEQLEIWDNPNDSHWLQTMVDREPEEEPIIKQLKAEVEDLLVQHDELKIDLNRFTSKSIAKELALVFEKVIGLGQQMQKLGLRKYSRTNSNLLADLRSMKAITTDYENQIKRWESDTDTSEVRFICDQLIMIITLLYNRIQHLELRVAGVSQLTTDIKELEQLLPGVSDNVARKALEQRIKEKHYDINQLRQSKISGGLLHPDYFSKRLSELMQTLDMSFASLGFPDGLDGRITFPLEEMVKVIKNPTAGGSIDVFIRKPNGSRGPLIGIYEGDYELLEAMISHPENQDLLFRMIHRTSKPLAINNSKEKKQRDRRHTAGKPGNNSSFHHGPGRYSGNR